MVDTLLFEPLLWHDVVDYPDLGAACLQGALQESGIRSKLVCTQLAYIEKLFLDCGP